MYSTHHIKIADDGLAEPIPAHHNDRRLAGRKKKEKERKEGRKGGEIRVKNTPLGSFLPSLYSGDICMASYVLSYTLSRCLAVRTGNCRFFSRKNM